MREFIVNSWEGVMNFNHNPLRHIPDLQVMKLVGVACCPSDAVPEIKSISKYISPINGGNGCVRDIIEQTLKVQNQWP